MQNMLRKLIFEYHLEKPSKVDGLWQGKYPKLMLSDGKLEARGPPLESSGTFSGGSVVGEFCQVRILSARNLPASDVAWVWKTTAWLFFERNQAVQAVFESGKQHLNTFWRIWDHRFPSGWWFPDFFQKPRSIYLRKRPRTLMSSDLTQLWRFGKWLVQAWKDLSRF